MNWNILLAVAIGALAATVAGLGGHLAASRAWQKWIFWGFGALMVILIWVQASLNERSQDRLVDRLNKIEAQTKQAPQVIVNVPPSVPPQIIVNPNPPPASPRPSSSSYYSGGFMQVSKAPAFYEGLLVAGMPVTANVSIENKGTEPVDGMYRYFAIALVDVGSTPEGTDSQAKAAFHNDMLRALKQWEQSKLTTPAIAVGVTVWNTLSLPPLTDEQVKRLKEGTTRLYIYTWARWSGEKHDLEQCTWPQIPADGNLHGELVWHVC